MLKNKSLDFFKLPVLPLKNVLLLPKVVIPVKVSRPLSISAANYSIANYHGEIFVTTQLSKDIDNITEKDLASYGVVARIFESIQDSDGYLKILVEGLYRAKIVDIEFSSQESLFVANLSKTKAIKPEKSAHAATLKEEAFVRNLKKSFKEFVSIQTEGSSQVVVKSMKNMSNLEDLVDIIAGNVDLSDIQKRFILEEANLFLRAEKIIEFLCNEVEISKAESSIRKRVQTQIEKHQKDYYLNEQVRAIYKELGREDYLVEVDNFKKQAKELKLSKEALEKLMSECKRLEQMQQTSPEAIVSRSYIDWLLAVPWYQKTKDQISISKAKTVFNSSHAGMEKAKNSILEYIGAKKFAKSKLQSSPIICLVGPPGVGKTSLANTIAQAMGRTFVKIALGGLRDEAEIRGHRRTYIGALPGKIISAMKKAQVMNPVILLDEVDKMSMDFRGDPSSALLEVLDPEQNKNFVDHFLEVGYDLSQVVFIATANSVENIPYPLQDRMEIISLSGYTEVEKLQIAKKFLLPRLMEEHNLENHQVEMSDLVINKVITEYTREAGVRSLNRCLLKIIRKIILELLVSNKSKKVVVSSSNLEKWLGYPKYKDMQLSKTGSIGVATGLAWTEVGGDILEVEVVKLKGKGGLTITGQLGEVMQESAQAALSYVRSRAKSLGLKDSFYSNYDLHIHIPEGATPKDGPSAGVTMTIALVSILTEVPVNSGLAMSGEISLQGRVLPVGGLREKILAAQRFNIKKVLVPKDNFAEVSEFIKEFHCSLEIVYASNLDEILDHAFGQGVFAASLLKSSSTSGSSTGVLKEQRRRAAIQKKASSKLKRKAK